MKVFTENGFRVVCLVIQLIQTFVFVVFLRKKRAVDGRAQTDCPYYVKNQVFNRNGQYRDFLSDPRHWCSGCCDVPSKLPNFPFLPEAGGGSAHLWELPSTEGAASPKIRPPPQGQPTSNDQPFVSIRITPCSKALP